MTFFEKIEKNPVHIAPEDIKVSVVIPTLNEGGCVGGIIQRVQKLMPGFVNEIIVVDGGSIDNTENVVRELGVKFLRHIERTRILFHLVSAESENPVKDYRAVRKELGAYNKSMLKKDEYLFLSKIDMTDSKNIKKRLTKLRKLNKNILPLSIHDFDSIQSVNKILQKIQKQKKTIIK